MKPEAIKAFKEEALKLGVELTADQLESFDRFMALLKKWNRSLNLTAFEDELDIVIFHFLDSLAVAKFIGENSFWMDIGSGAGFPGIPCKICRPEARGLLIEKREKKVNFLTAAIRNLKLQKIEAVAQEADDPVFKNDMKNRLDVVMLRAVSEPENAFDIGADYVKEGGSVTLFITAAQLEKNPNLFNYAKEKGFCEGESFEYRLPRFDQPRYIVQLICKERN